MAMALGSFASRVVATQVVATDGTGDFTTIQAAINALPAGGGVVYIKEGTYTITTAISITSDNISLVGAGKSTKIQTTSDITMININGADSVTVESVYLYGAGTGKTNNKGISLASTSNSYIHLCWIENTGSDGIYIGGGTIDNYVSDNIITAGFSNGINTYTNDRGFIINNIVTDMTSSGIYVSTTHLGIVISGNLLEGNGGTGMTIRVTAGIISNNIVLSNTGHGIHITNCSDCVVSNNTIQSNDVDNTATYDGIYLSNSSYYNIIEGNRCEDNDRYEINIVDNTNVGNFIHGNHCRGTDHEGTINDAGTGTTLADNVTA